MPRRVGGLWPRLVGFPNLLLAHRKARRGKRERPAVIAFEFELERNLVRLQNQLAQRTYRPGLYRTFTIREPKPRLISAAPYRDRVVHHALMNVLEPVLDARLSPDSFACRRGRGTHACLDRYTRYARRYEFVWHGDISRFYASLDHEIVRRALSRVLKDDRVLELLKAIIDAGPDQDVPMTWFPGDDLFTPLMRRRGLPIGNLTSQWLANLYLDPLDRFVRQILRAPGYLRYCDDFCVFGNDRSRIKAQVAETHDFLVERLRLELNPRHLDVQRTGQGVTFLGMRMFPHRRRIAPASLARSVRRLRRRLARSGRVLDARGRLAAAMPWIAHLAHADTWGLRARVLTRLCAHQQAQSPKNPERFARE